MLNIEKSKELIDKISEITGILDWQVVSFCDDFDKKPRYYHNSDHILEMCEGVFKLGLDGSDTRKLIWAAFFHDAVYDSKSDTNEEDSAELFKRYVKDPLHYGLVDIEQDEIQEVYDIIIDTKTHEPRTELSYKLCNLDLSGFKKPFNEILETEYKIRKEYEWADWSDYKKGKLQFLNSYYNKKIVNDDIAIKRGIFNLSNYIRRENPPNIAVYPGSFNDFHKGHLNILEKAEAIFDKVIIAYGQNPQKQTNDIKIPKEIQNRQIDIYQGSLPEYIQSKNYPVTIIRGLRNETDLQYELNQYRWLQEILPNIKLISIFCDKEYQHISSSSIRELEKYPDLKETANKYKL